MAKEPLIGLVMIGKNEAERLPRVFESVGKFVDTITFCDTGSDDDTLKIAREFAKEKNGRVYRHKWRNFGHNLNLAHARARGTARWLLWLHCDMTIEVNPKLKPWLRRGRKSDPECWDVDVYSGSGATGTRYLLPLLMRGDLDWQYVGPAHEYLEHGHRLTRKLNGISVYHHADGANRGDKYQRDIDLLRDGFRARDGRAIFYTAQSHACLGHIEQAALIYELRASMNGWEEERWYAAYRAAALRDDVERLIEVWRERPWRHEPLTEAGRIIARMNPNAMSDILFLERPALPA
jgi:glycosyltransferase involved in cell wall biosynthesis